MSRSIHITKKNFKGLTKKELDEQAEDPNSELREWVRKSELKKEIKKKRKNEKNN
jgi:TfoX/Sxy family transcriptional regulator of competence genes